MTHETLGNRNERIPEIVVKPPLVESFLDTEKAAELWPAEIANNENFVEQVATRQELIESLDHVVGQLPRPDISLQDAIRLDHLSEPDVARLYDSISALFETSEDYDSLALFLPFEFLPDAAWQPATAELENASKRFHDAYLKAWQNSFGFYDVRANFVDGDIRENGEPNPRVVKAAHLIPKLVEKGLIDTADVFYLVEENTDEILKQSIADTLPVLADLALLSQADFNRMAESKDVLLRNTAKAIQTAEAKNDKPNEAPKVFNLTEQRALLEKTLAAIDAEELGDVSEKRKTWLRREKRKQAIDSAAEALSSAIINSELDPIAIASLNLSETHAINQQVIIEGIRKAVESTAATSATTAQKMFSQHKETLRALTNNASPAIQNALTKIFNRLYHLDILSADEIQEFDITPTDLSRPMSENLPAMRQETEAIREAISTIEENPELAKMIYPMILLNGSRLKGYGDPDADIDVSVFIKPGTPESSRPRLQALLQQVFISGKIEGPFIEFWLDETPDGLTVHNFAENDIAIGKSKHMDNLFGSAWEGDPNVIQEIREKLLIPYLQETSSNPEKNKLRMQCLADMERAILIYRLLHQGYEKFYPPFGGINTSHADAIDGKSVFYDSGYRQLATKLFVNRVFLPIAR